MTVISILRTVLIGAGVLQLLAALLALVGRKITETLCVPWGVSALLTMAAGVLPYPAEWTRELSVRGLAPVIAAGAVLLLFAFFISVWVSSRIRGRDRSAMEEALLRFEQEDAAERDPSREPKELLVILPAYNEEKSLPGLLRQLEEAGVREIADLLIIDDGSDDRTSPLAREMGYRCVKGLHLGYGRALQTGYLYASRAGYRFVIQMDADGQHDPCNVRPLYQALREPGADGGLPDIVLGSRFLPGGKSFPMPGAKLLAIRLFRLTLRLATGQRISDPTTGLQGLSARAAACYAGEGNFDSRYPDANMLLQMLLRGYRLREIPAVMHERRLGREMYIGFRPFEYMFHAAFSICAVYLREAPPRRRRKNEVRDL